MKIMIITILFLVVSCSEQPQPQQKTVQVFAEPADYFSIQESIKR